MVIEEGGGGVEVRGGRRDRPWAGSELHAGSSSCDPGLRCQSPAGPDLPSRYCPVTHTHTHTQELKTQHSQCERNSSISPEQRAIRDGDHHSWLMLSLQRPLLACCGCSDRTPDWRHQPCSPAYSPLSRHQSGVITLWRTRSTSHPPAEGHPVCPLPSLPR